MAVGVRPEQVAVAAEGNIKGTAQFVEDTGPEKFLHVALDGNEKLVVRVGSTESYTLGDTISLTIHPHHAHLFEAP